MEQSSLGWGVMEVEILNKHVGVVEKEVRTSYRDTSPIWGPCIGSPAEA